MPPAPIRLAPEASPSKKRRCEDDRPALLAEPGLVEAEHVEAVEHRRGGQHLAHRHHPGAAHARHEHGIPVGTGRGPVRLGDVGRRLGAGAPPRPRPRGCGRPLVLAGRVLTRMNDGQSPSMHV